MRFVIDGSTGLLGRNLLFEILKQNLIKLDDIEIIILGKGTNGSTLESRMNKIIIEDGFNYLNLENNNDNFEQIRSRIIYIEFDLTMADLGISKANIEILMKKKIDFFFHNAALLNFGDSIELTKSLQLINFESNKILLELVSVLDVREFIYVSTAYSAGASKQEIMPDYINNTCIFRNPYEKSKLGTELYLMEFAKREHLRYKIFRTSTISGRLIENEIGSINKFDVFYGWGLYFLKNKIKHFKNSNDIYSEKFELNLRIHKHPKNTMNIIPVDFCAKLMFNTCLQGHRENSFHLINEKEFPTENVINIILRNLNITGHSFVNEEPLDKSPLEQIYYRSVGKIFTPYIIDQELHYNNENLQDLMKKHNLKCPEMNETNFQKLIDYAKKHNFGIEKN